MHILISGGSSWRLSQLNTSWVMISLTVVAVITLMGAAGYTGFYLASPDSTHKVEMNTAATGQLYISQSLSEEINVQKLQINTAVLDAQENLNALAMRLGVIQAKVTRLEAASSRLTSVVGISSDEFDFEQIPAIGGMMDAEYQQEFNVPDFIQSMEALSEKVDDHKQQLSMLDSMMLVDKLENAAVPSGNPIADGWISSGFGKRTDPVSGKHDFHKGLDFAGKKGTEIYAVSNGVVTWSGKQKGYGNLVEIDHGHGYVTRYAHNEENLVKVGDKVEKGQTIALMGSTGRSTGTHVHIEVEQDGKLIDPRPYLKPLG